MQKIDLNQLNEPLPYKWRVQSQYPKNAPTKCRCIAYIDARQVAKRLDDVCGKANWCSENYELKGNIYCKLGILINGEWVYKTDVGTSGNIEKEKSEVSDALKRAAVQWGIGRDLYNMGTVELGFNSVKKKPSHKGKVIWDAKKLAAICDEMIKQNKGGSVVNEDEEEPPPKLNTKIERIKQHIDKCPTRKRLELAKIQDKIPNELNDYYTEKWNTLPETK